MEPYDPEKERYEKLHYMFIRARTNLDYEAESLNHLSEIADKLYSHVELLTFGQDASPWDDGLALRIRARNRPYEIAKSLAGPLNRFDDWAVIEPLDEEYVSRLPGALDMFFGLVRDGRRDDHTVRQIYAASNEAETNINQCEEDINSELNGLLRPIFRFRCGFVILLYTDEPPSITAQRCARPLRNLSGWTVIGPNGASHPEGGAWRQFWFDDLPFMYGEDWDDESEGGSG